MFIAFRNKKSSSLGHNQWCVSIQGVSKKKIKKKDLACHCALISGCMNVIFAWS